MLDKYYLGANTPQGFRSEYGGLQDDPRIRKLWILKGGSGCGKSTLMKTLARRAEAAGYRTEWIPCSSDPDSLDGLVIPALGAALVDGTAPHVLEPRLCGCGANYVNLGACYREAALEEIALELRKTKAANAACYVPAYAALRAAGALLDGLRSIAPSLTENDRRAILRRLRDVCPAAGIGTGTVRRVFLSAITPKGLLTAAAQGFRSLVIEDPFCKGGPLLAQLADRLRRDRFDLVLAMDPMDPEVPAGVVVEGEGVAFFRSTPLFPVTDFSETATDLGPLLPSPENGTAAESARAALLQLRALVGQAVTHLRQAKEYHDRLEELCRPAVDFSRVDRITARLSKVILGA